jgi:hypothetical protein
MTVLYIVGEAAGLLRLRRGKHQTCADRQTCKK